MVRWLCVVEARFSIYTINLLSFELGQQDISLVSGNHRGLGKGVQGSKGAVAPLYSSLFQLTCVHIHCLLNMLEQHVYFH